MIFQKTIRIGDKVISDNSPVFIIAEAGVNHGGDMKLARKLIDTAIDSGADAVKFQAFRSENLILKSVKKAPYQKKTTGSKESQFEMLKKLELTSEQNKVLQRYCKRRGVIFLTTPFDEESLEDLDKLNLPAYKVSSTDLTNLPFLKRVALKGKPIILSTGMSYLSEVELALKEIYPYNKNVVLLQCTGNYPFEEKEANLLVIKTYMSSFDILIGFSDHSVGIGASPYAVAMGSKVIEKHFTINKSMEGPDHKASLDPEELKQLIQEIRKVERYLGSGTKYPTLSETSTRTSLQKCLVAAKAIKKGELFTERNIVAKRTGNIGISPIYYMTVIGQRAEHDYERDDIIGV